MSAVANEYLAVFPAVPPLSTAFMIEEARYRAHVAGLTVEEGPAEIWYHDRFISLEPIVVVSVPVKPIRKLQRPRAGRYNSVQILDFGRPLAQIQ